IQYQLAGPWLDSFHHQPAPRAVLTQGQHVVGQVITSRDPVEHSGYIAPPFGEGGTGLVAIRHTFSLPRGTDI
ncbi:MAG: hypothetical protein QOF35_2150, partial [Actinomycetota bacterium]|nr:hypothetical protein [Actinomycetota bacterium]